MCPAGLGHVSLADPAAADPPASRRGIATGPQNEAVVAGSTLVLRCESDAPVGVSRVAWYEYAYSPIGSIVSDNEDIVPSHPQRARYRIIHERDTQFDLEIRDALVTDGGTYRCRDMNDNAPNMYYRQAELTVLGEEVPGSYGEFIASYGEFPGSYGLLIAFCEEFPGSYEEFPGSYGEFLGSYGEFPGSFGEFPGSYGEFPGSWGELPCSI